MKKILHIFKQGLASAWLFESICSDYVVNQTQLLPDSSKINNRDGLILIQDGVYFIGTFRRKQLLLPVYVLGVDLEARGLLHVYHKIGADHHASSQINLITYEHFVNLVVQYDTNIVW